MLDRPTFKIQKNEKYITSLILPNIIKSSTIPKAYLEEVSSELWYESKSGIGKIIFKNDVTYEGFVKHGILHNENPEQPCKITFPDGTVYTGTIINNEITGEGKYTFNDGSIYEGSLLNGLRHGEGMFKTNDGIYYKGGWKNGLKNGKGKIIQGNMELEGEWINDILSGKCRIKWKSGNLFDGILLNNKMNGNGYMVWYNKNEKYTGMWKDNLQNGYGVYICYDLKNENKFFRERYVGEWKDGKRNGYGIFYYSNGNIYEGEWRNNIKEGFGLLYYNDRAKYIGTFKKDNIFDGNNENIKKTDLKKSKMIKDKKIHRINKNIDEIKLNISINDIIKDEPNKQKLLKEIDNLILRNLSIITHLYLYACGKEEIKTMDIGISTLGSASINESKINKFSHRNSKMNNDINLKQIDSQAIQPEKLVENKIDLDNIYNNDLYFCLDFNRFWKLIRECDLITSEISLAMINRICFQNPDNKIEMFYIPDDLTKNINNNSNNEEKDKIYNYLYNKIQLSKINFENKYKDKIKQSHNLIDENNKEKEIINENNKISNDKEDINYFDFHDGKNVILLRYFYEIIIRIAHIKYNQSDMTLFTKTKKLLDELKSFLKLKIKTGNIDNAIMSSILMIDPKLKNIDIILGKFLQEYEVTLHNLFIDIYKCSCNNENSYNPHDMTITYRYIYDKIISNCEPIAKIFENKLEYIDLISLYIRDKKINSYNYNMNSQYNEYEIMEYIDSLLDREMIFREFCELMFFISRKYFIFYGLNKEEEMNTINSNNKSQSIRSKKTTKKLIFSNKNIIKVDKEEGKENEEKKEIKEVKEIDNYKIIINYFIIEKDKLMKINKYTGINKYNYPVLKTHQLIAKHIEDERKRKIEEERKEKEKQRYSLERKILKEEDQNVYIEEDERENDSNSFEEDL